MEPYSVQQTGLSLVMGHGMQRLTAAGQQSNQKETLVQLKSQIIKNMEFLTSRHVFDKLIWPPTEALLVLLFTSVTLVSLPAPFILRDYYFLWCVNK